MRGSRGIQAVTFDVGGTLIEPWPSLGHVYADVAARNGIPDLSPAELQIRFATAFRKRSRSIHSGVEWAVIVDETFAGLTPRPPSETFFPELYERFASASAWRIYDDVWPALQAMAGRGLRLGVISNWDDRLRRLLEALDLARCFEVIVISCEVGTSKPSPEIFAEAVKRLGVPAMQILHVGDSRAMDFEGACSAGLSAVQIARGCPSPRDGQIPSLLQLAAIVDASASG